MHPLSCGSCLAEKGTEENMKKGKKHGALRVLLIVAICVLCAVLVFWGLPLTEHLRSSDVTGGPEWMAGLDDSLPLNEIVIPGTHDSATRYAQLAFFSRCQSLDIAGQLESGVRFLDIRLGMDGGTMKLMHGFTECRTGPFPWSRTLTLDALLEDCYAFLDTHPSETILFSVKQEHGDEPVEDFQRLLDSILSRQPDRWLLCSGIPELRQARGKLVLLRRFEDRAGLGGQAGISMQWDNQNLEAGKGLSIVEKEQDSYLLWVQDRFEYGTDDKWSAFSAGLSSKDVAQADLALHYLSTKGTGTYGHPFRYAKKLNPKLMELDSARLRGWIIADFMTADLAEHIYRANYE